MILQCNWYNDKTLLCFERVVGLQSVLVTDRDGIPLIRVANEHAPELAMKPSFISTFTMATDQSSKIGLGKNQTIICMYSNYQVRSLLSFSIYFSQQFHFDFWVIVGGPNE